MEGHKQSLGGTPPPPRSNGPALYYLCIYFSNKERKRLEFCVVFCLVIVVFNQSKNNAVLEPRTAQFRRLVGFEAKDLSFETKAKDFKACPR